MKALAAAVALLLAAPLAPTAAALYCVPLSSCHADVPVVVDLSDVPRPEPGEPVPAYIARVLVWVCTDLARQPPTVEVSDKCGPRIECPVRCEGSARVPPLP